MGGPVDFTDLLRRAADGSTEARDELFERSYRELEQLARGYLARERPGHTLQTDALVHEAYVRMVDGSRLSLTDRAHFLAVAAQVMRRILVDHARRRFAAKRSGRQQRISLEQVATIGGDQFNTDLLALDVALERLQQEQPEKAQVVEMRFFAGMTVEEIAEVMQLTARTIHRYWAYAQARLYKEMTTGFDPAA